MTISKIWKILFIWSIGTLLLIVACVIHSNKKESSVKDHQENIAKRKVKANKRNMKDRQSLEQYKGKRRERRTERQQIDKELRQDKFDNILDKAQAIKRKKDIIKEELKGLRDLL